MPRFWPAALAAVLVAGPLAAADTAELIARVKKVGREGAVNADAAAAVRELSALGAAAVPDLLAAVDGNLTASNYLLTATDAIAQRDKANLPADKLTAFAKDGGRDARARRLAFELLTSLDPRTPEKLLPTMLDDPGQELRREAVAFGLKKLPEEPTAADVPALKKLFDAARDTDQVEEVTKKLEKLGEKPDTTAHFGFVTRWNLALAWDNTGGAGWASPYPPEGGVSLSATYPGKKDAPAKWVSVAPGNKNAQVDINKTLGKQKSAVAYAWVAFDSPAERPAQIRVGSPNAVKIYLNGKEIYGREEYHRGFEIDQHIGSGTLKAGRNEVLVKLCQNDQTEQWAQDWTFTGRVTDHLGGAVPITLRPEWAPAVEVPKDEKKEGKK